MGDPPSVRDDETHPVAPHISVVRRSHGSGVVFALVAIALILAIGFFYMTNERRGDARADKITEAAGSVDDAAKVVGEAARNAADTLRNDH
jgi:uncharacterized protein HemX